jgi:hypothetical protein
MVHAHRARLLSSHTARAQRTLVAHAHCVCLLRLLTKQARRARSLSLLAVIACCNRLPSIASFASIASLASLPSFASFASITLFASFASFTSLVCCEENKLDSVWSATGLLVALSGERLGDDRPGDDKRRTECGLSASRSGDEPPSTSAASTSVRAAGAGHKVACPPDAAMVGAEAGLAALPPRWAAAEAVAALAQARAQRVGCVLSRLASGLVSAGAGAAAAARSCTRSHVTSRPLVA